MTRDYRKDVAIDPHNLHEEWIKQSTIFMNYSEQLAKAKEIFRELKESKTFTEAELGLDIKKNFKTYGYEKAPTETTIKNEVITHDDYQTAVKEMLKQQSEVDYLEVAVKSMEMKKKALEELVVLHNAEYFSSPSDIRTVSGGKWDYDKINKMEEASRTKLNKKRRAK